MDRFALHHRVVERKRIEASSMEVHGVMADALFDAWRVMGMNQLREAVKKATPIQVLGVVKGNTRFEIIPSGTKSWTHSPCQQILVKESEEAEATCDERSLGRASRSRRWRGELVKWLHRGSRRSSGVERCGRLVAASPRVQVLQLSEQKTCCQECSTGHPVEQSRQCPNVMGQHADPIPVVVRTEDGVGETQDLCVQLGRLGGKGAARALESMTSAQTAKMRAAQQRLLAVAAWICRGNLRGEIEFEKKKQCLDRLKVQGMEEDARNLDTLQRRWHSGSEQVGHGGVSIVPSQDRQGRSKKEDLKDEDLPTWTENTSKTYHERHVQEHGLPAARGWRGGRKGTITFTLVCGHCEMFLC